MMAHRIVEEQREPAPPELLMEVQLESDEGEHHDVSCRAFTDKLHFLDSTDSATVSTSASTIASGDLSYRARCVRFSDEPPTCSEASPAMTDEEKAAAWWKPIEFRLFRRTGKRVVQTMANSDHSTHLTKVYQRIASVKVGEQLEPLQPQVPRILADSPVRGLEVLVHQQIMIDRRAHVLGVMAAQSKLAAVNKSANCTKFSSEDRCKYLAACSALLSRQARTMGFIMALGDEEIVERLLAC